MANCTPEFWTLKDIRDALEKEANGNKKIVIPMFQRGKRWNKDKKDTFIDSLRKRYPIGTLLFYKTVEGTKEVYTLIDGLQRGSAIKDYLSNPSKFFALNDLDIKSLETIYSLIISGGNTEIQKEKINNLITNYIHKLDKYESLEIIDLFNLLSFEFPTLKEKNKEFADAIRQDFKHLKDDYNSLSQMTIPAIVYTGEESTLPEIFKRINSQGVALTEFEIYAASWPREEFPISNENIIDLVLRKYDSLNDNEYTISGYDRNQKRMSKMVNAFEYTFGLSKYLQNTYHSLKFNMNLNDDETNPIAFQILNACFNTSHSQIKDVHKIISRFKHNIEILENALLSTVVFVEKCIEPILRFKGNNRKESSKILHSQFQIMSLISFAFRKKYDIEDSGLKINERWKESKTKLEQNIWKYYIFDIISKYWNEGGTNKIHSANVEDRYVTLLSYGQFSSAYDSYSETLFSRREQKNVFSPSDIDYVILNAIYVKSFSAMDQLSINRFDVEHIAPKDQMKKLIKDCKGDGLPISHIANICYLPEYENRSKGSKNFYQDENYKRRASMPIEIIEQKYSFTKRTDLEFMDIEYREQDFDVLKTYYLEFLSTRNKIVKEKLLNSLGLEKTEEVHLNEPTFFYTEFDEKYYRLTKIGKIVKEGFAYLLENNKLLSSDITNLQDKIYSSRVLGCDFPVLVENVEKTSDVNGVKRYYKDPIIVLGKPMYLSKEWFDTDRKKVVAWLKSKMS